MPSPGFVYHRPQTLAEASEIALNLGENAIFLAGGTEIIPDYRRGREFAEHLVSLRKVPGLDGIREESGGLVIGAMTRLADVAASPLVRRVLPALADAAGWIGGAQIRSQGTIGGNFCRAVPCADTPPPCIVGGATVRLTGPNGDRTMAAEEFFLGPRATSIDRGEILTAIVIPPPPGRSGTAYARFALRKGQALAVASVAARLVLDGEEITGARVALGAVAPVPKLATATGDALVGGPATDERFEAAAKIAAEEAEPIADIRGSEEYRRELVKVLTVRACREAAARAREGGEG